MRIVGIEIVGHPGIGDLTVDFRSSNGDPSRLIVVAGENGAGKTVILETIFAALAPTDLLLNQPRRLSGGSYRVLVELDAPSTGGAFYNVISYEVFSEIRDRWPGFQGIAIDFGDSAAAQALEWPFHAYSRLSDNTRVGSAQNSINVLPPMATCFYSEANVSFEVPNILSIGTSASPAATINVPVHQRFPFRGGTTLAQEVAQLFVDLQAADDAEVARWLDANDGRPPEALRNRRVKHFAEAFERVVPNKRFVGTETVNGEHRAVFEQNGFRTPLANLSTGEKQIVFRGAFLLRQAERLPGSVVLIDEPELSLHPLWQAGVLPYYDSIVSEDDDRKSQIIVATHSPFVVHGSPTAKHIILRRDAVTGRVSVDGTPNYPSINSTEVAVAAFDLAELGIAARPPSLIVVTEGSTDKTILSVAWDKLYPDVMPPFVIHAAGGARAVNQMLGSSQVGKAGPLLDATSAAGVSNVVGIFDFDAEGFGQWNGTIKRDHAEEVSEIAPCIYRKRSGANVWALLLPVPSFRASYAGLDQSLGSRSILTIELLFPDEFVAHLIDSVPVPGAPGVQILRAQTEAQKQAVADAATTFPPSAFEAFRPIFERLLSVSSTQPS